MLTLHFHVGNPNVWQECRLIVRKETKYGRSPFRNSRTLRLLVPVAQMEKTIPTISACFKLSDERHISTLLYCLGAEDAEDVLASTNHEYKWGRPSGRPQEIWSSVGEIRYPFFSQTQHYSYSRELVLTEDINRKVNQQSSYHCFVPVGGVMWLQRHEIRVNSRPLIVARGPHI